MDNSFGTRPPWTGRPPGGAYPPQAVMRGMQPGIDPRYMPDLSAHNGGQLMNGYGVGPGIRPGIATPSSVSGGYPMWDMDVPSQMFMHTVNFDRLMQQQGMVDLNTSVSTASNRPDDVSQRSGNNNIHNKFCFIWCLKLLIVLLQFIKNFTCFI